MVMTFPNNTFYLMNKDETVLQFHIEETAIRTKEFVEDSRLNEVLPIGFTTINEWIANRQAPKHREHMEKLLRACGCYDLDGFIRVTRALSLNDTFWVKPIDSNLKWSEVSLYTNEFNETIARLAFEGGLYGEQFSSTSPEFGTSGAYAKCWVRDDNGIYLLKRGSEGTRNAGLEPYSEFYSAQIAKLICKSYVDYELVIQHGKLASKCKLFTDEYNGFAPISRLVPPRTQDSVIFNFMENNGFGEDFRRMVVLDALILNTDRHRGNYGIMFDTTTMELKTMAPVFDNNQSLLPFAEKDDFETIDDYLESRPTRIGDDFNDMANSMLTPAIKADLRNLIGFKFKRDDRYNLPEERLIQLEQVIQGQIDKILKGIRLYVPKEIVEPIIKHEIQE
jgi:hypothetical protein